ncbi:unnamed protein product [Dibothriocephalus latus]|uniref:Uncharacterized protein n=1 Tax=Dibothriocephalus latus TaxID=60516 RepID=A0A3P7QBB1_DIBLA|nr:unnamed protein product [Dibothriocephalus latus]
MQDPGFVLVIGDCEVPSQELCDVDCTITRRCLHEGPVSNIIRIIFGTLYEALRSQGS